MTQQYSTSSYGITLVPTTTEKTGSPKGLLVTRAVETQEGWVGHIIVDKVIVWQSNPVEDEETAVQEATERVVTRLKKLFA